MRKTVLITGASGGIGQALARAFAADGYTVCLHYHNDLTAVTLAEELRAAGCDAAAFAADVADPAAVSKMMREVLHFAGHLDVLVNNAGITQQKLLTDTTDEDWRRMMGVHVDGAFYLCREALPSMLANRRGCILNIASVWGVCGASCEVAYSAAKAGLIGLTKSLAKEVGLSGVRVNAIAPGVIDTPMNAMHDAATMQALCEEIPLGRIGLPEEVAHAAVFLASDRAAYITGQTLGVDGGFGI